jgi:hypothetical protein
VVTDGAEVPSIDILIRPEAVAKISGRVVSPFPDADVPPKDSQNLFLITQNPDALAETLRPFVQNEAANRANGRFELRNVLPGSYDLVARVQDISGRVAWGRTRVNVGSADIDGVTVETRLGHAIKARLSIDGDPGPSPGAAPPDAEGNGPAVEPQPGAASAGDPVKKDVKPDIMLQLQSSEPYSLHAVGAAGQTTFDPASNVYTFPNVPEGRYRFHVDPLPPNSYVEDVREGSVSVFDEGLSVAGGPPGDVVVLVNSRGATISGVVTAADQKTFEGAQVALVPAAFARRSNLLLYKSARTGERGEFEMHGVAPGEYRLFAWENVPDNAWLNADFMALQEARGKSVKVPAAGTATADLKLIPKEIR